jgi:hypothetical protein
MLNRAILIQKTHKMAKKIFLSKNSHVGLLRKLWGSIGNNNVFKAFIEKFPPGSFIPIWKNHLTTAIPIKTPIFNYSILGVDGSQIYPNRHIGLPECFIINTGSCFLSYFSSGTSKLASIPELYVPDKSFKSLINEISSQEFINLERENMELKEAFLQGLTIQTKPLLVLLDGSIIFWYLNTKPKAIKKHFFSQYIATLQQFCDNAILMGSFISFPKSKELVQLLKIKLCCSPNTQALPCSGKNPLCSCTLVDFLKDTDIVSWFVPPNNRTTIFYNRSPIAQEYPEHLKPCYFYLNVGKEIARIECPKWIAENPKYIEFISKICLDQCNKGHGYPVALAEAHEQAVIKEADRQFFFNLISKIGFKYNHTTTISRKLLRKQKMGI